MQRRLVKNLRELCYSPSDTLLDGKTRLFRLTSRWLTRMPKWLVLALGTLAIAAIGFVDSLAGPSTNLEVFYLMPIGMLTWLVHREAGLLGSLLSAIAGAIGEWPAMRASHWVISVWNIAANFLVFGIVVFLLSNIKNRLHSLEELANLDPLTQIANRRAFNRSANLETMRCRRFGSIFSLAYIDIDNFKTFNDSFGHSAGDELLTHVATILQENTRATDTVARLGGDEFVVLLPRTDPDEAELVVAKLHQMLLEAIADRPAYLTFSIGVITFIYPPDSVDEALRIVDDLMYDVKRSGKNSVRFESWVRPRARAA